MGNDREKALIAMSGGVDSSVAAKLTLDMGYECLGCMMRLFDNAGVGIQNSRACCSLDDAEDARSAAYRLGIPFYVFNFTDDFREIVIKKFISTYENSYTPNPCIDCNRYMKFDKLYNRAKLLGCDFIVTGHYARIERENGRYLLKKGLDESKDQSYVLYSLTQEQLAHTLFPLGGMSKREVRRLAAHIGLSNAEKPDSQDICFVPDGDYASVIERYTKKAAPIGSFVDRSGNILGQNKGIIHYTIGQRKGLGLSLPTPMYVCDICPDSGNVVLGTEKELFGTEAQVFDFNWISGNVPKETFRCKVKIRYRQKEQWATVTPEGSDRVHLSFDTPQRAITPGQAAVLYDVDIILGGGTIGQSTSTT